MRTAFIDTLVQAAAENPRIWLVTGDIGFSVVETFAERFPDRFVNAGVAEQNMTGVAAGLALTGAIVVTYSIANFPTLRCLEQIRNDVCAHNLPVKIVAVGGGLTYAAAGYSHQAVEDFAFLGSLPNMTVVAPGDPVETRLALRAILQSPGPAYLRLGKTGERTVHASEPPFSLGKMIPLMEGRDVTIVCTGAMLDNCVSAAEVLAKRNVSVTLLSSPTLVPFDTETLLKSAEATGRIVTVEEHGPGGLAALAGEAMASAGIAARLLPIRLSRQVLHLAGSQAPLRAGQGLSVAGIVSSVESTL